MPHRMLQPDIAQTLRHWTLFWGQSQSASHIICMHARVGGEGRGGEERGGEGSGGEGGEGRDDCYTYSNGTTIFK